MSQFLLKRRTTVIAVLTAVLLVGLIGVANATTVPAGCDPNIDTSFSGTCQAARLSVNGDTAGGLAAWAQRTVNDTGTKSLTVDGLFGSATESGVEDYQDDTGTTVDGIVGSNTWIRMDIWGDIAPWTAVGGCVYGMQYYSAGSGTNTARACDSSHSNLSIDEFCVKVSGGTWKVADTTRWTTCT